MAVLVEAYTVVIRRSSIRRAFTGEERAFEARLPNLTGAKDDHLYRIGFFDYFDAEDFITRILTPAGLAWVQGEEAVEVSLVDQLMGLHHFTPWLEVGQLPVAGGKVTAAWLAGTEPGELAVHTKFSYQEYSSLERWSHGETAGWLSEPTSNPLMHAVVNPETGRTIYTTRNTVASALPPTPVISPGVKHEVLAWLENTWWLAHKVLGDRRGVSSSDAPSLERARTELEGFLFAVRVLAHGSFAADAAAHFTEGYVLMALGRDAEAEPALRRAFALAPTDNIAVELMANLSTLGRDPEAIAIGRRLVVRHFLYPQVLVNLALCLHRAGEYDEALARLDQYLAEHPQSAEVLDFRRRVEAARNRRHGLLGRLLRRRD